MSLLCSCHKCGKPTPFDRPCQSCGFEDPVYPDTIENVAKKWLEKHEKIEAPEAEAVIEPPAVQAAPAPTPAVPIPIPQSSSTTNPASIPATPAPPVTAVNSRPPRQTLGAPLAVFIHPFFGICAGVLLGYSLLVDDFTERLIYYCAAGIVLMVDMVMLVGEASRIESYCRSHFLTRIFNALATLPVCVVLVLMGVDEMTLGFALLPGGWLLTLWGLKSLGVGLALTLLGVGFGVYTCELITNKKLI